MKITLTWKASMQISPDDFAEYTKVFHCDENMTLKELHTQLTNKFVDKNFDCELHFNM